MVYYTRKRRRRFLTFNRFKCTRNPWRIDKLHIPLSKAEANEIAKTFGVKIPYLHGTLKGDVEKIETRQRDREVVLFALRLGKGIFCIFAPFGFWLSVKANRRCFFEIYRSHRRVFRLLKIRFREFLKRISYLEVFLDRPPFCGIVIDPPRKWTRSKKRFTYIGNNGLRTTYIGARGYKQVVVYQKPRIAVSYFPRYGNLNKPTHSGNMEKISHSVRSRLEIRLWGKRHYKLIRSFLTFINNHLEVEDEIITTTAEVDHKFTGRDPPVFLCFGVPPAGIFLHKKSARRNFSP